MQASDIASLIGRDRAIGNSGISMMRRPPSTMRAPVHPPLSDKADYDGGDRKYYPGGKSQRGGIPSWLSSK
jgi:hypothetical protein